MFIRRNIIEYPLRIGNILQICRFESTSTGASYSEKVLEVQSVP